MRTIDLALVTFALTSVVSAQDRLENLRRGTPNGAWRSTYEPLPSRPTVIRSATLITAAGSVLEDTDLFMRDGKIETIGSNLRLPAWVPSAEF